MSIFFQSKKNQSAGTKVRVHWSGSKYMQRVLVIAALMMSSSLSLAQQTDEVEVLDAKEIKLLIERRQVNYGDIGAGFKSMTDELRKKKPGMYMYRRYLKQVLNLSHDQNNHDWFPPGTGPETGIETAALPAIWTNKAEYQEWAEALPNEGDKLMEIVTSKGELSEVKKQHKVLGKTCKGCHKPFRAEED